KPPICATNAPAGCPATQQHGAGVSPRPQQREREAGKPASLILRRKTMKVAREERRLAEVSRADELRRPALETESEPAVRRHPVAERLEVRVERLRCLARGCERP